MPDPANARPLLCIGRDHGVRLHVIAATLRITGCRALGSVTDLAAEPHPCAPHALPRVHRGPVLLAPGRSQHRYPLLPAPLRRQRLRRPW